MTCPTEDDLDRFLTGQLNSSSIETLEAHVDQCSRCEAELVRRARVAHGRVALNDGDALLGRGDEVGRFLILDLLGSGSMGTVYSAFDPVLEREVALKVLDGWTEPANASAQLTLREARALARVNHPNVVSIYEAGEADGVAFIAMQLVVGQPLNRWLNQPRSRGEVLRVFREVAHGLAALHATGLVHRDVKPTNVLVGDDGRALLSDFGLAGSSTQVRAGTMAWVAPEVRRGQPADARSDQYSLCQTFAEALAGAAPGRSAAPAWVRSALERGLADDPSMRFSSVHELAEALAERPARPWPWLAAAVVGAAMVISALVERDPCAPSPALLEALWSDETRASLAETLRDDEAALEGAVTALSSIREEWAFSSQSLCRASREGLLFGASLETAQQCLSERHGDTVRVVTVLTGNAPGLAQRAHSLVESLRSPTDCLVRDVGLRQQPPRDDPGLAAAVEAIEADLEVARLERDRGDVRKARALVEPLLNRAKQTGFVPVMARVGFRLGSLDAKLGHHELAIERLERSVVDGLASGSDEAALQSAILLVYEHGVVQADPSKALHFAQMADALLRRHPSLHRLGAGLRLNRGLVLEGSGSLDAALEEVRLAVWQFEAQDPAGFATGNALLNRARLEVMTGSVAEAEVTARRALTLIEATRGPGHPHLAVGKQILGVVDREKGANASALAHFREAEASSSRALGGSHEQTLGITDDIHRTLLALGRNDEALEGAARLVADRPSLASLTTLAECHWAVGDLARAREAIEAAAASASTAERGDALGRLALLEARWLRAAGATGSSSAITRALRSSWRGSVVERDVVRLIADRFGRAPATAPR